MNYQVVFPLKLPLSLLAVSSNSWDDNNESRRPHFSLELQLHKHICVPICALLFQPPHLSHMKGLLQDMIYM